MRTPFGDLDPRRAARMTMAELDEALRRPVARRSMVKGMAAAGAASPLLWVRPSHAAEPPTGHHLTFGADPAREIVVSWSTEGVVTNPVLELGTDESYGTRVRAETRTVRGTSTLYHHAVLDHLLPATTYHYRQSHVGAASKDRTFTTASLDPTRKFRFTAFGDQGVTAKARDLAGLIARLDPAFHLHAGDLCYATPEGDGGTDPHFDVDVWDHWLAQNRPVANKGIPWMPTVGNHEMEPGLGPQGYDGMLGRFVLPRNGVAGGPATWWFRYGNVGVVGLDGNDASFEIPRNNGYLGARQDAWLDRTLGRLRRDPRVDFIVVAFHNCMYCSLRSHGSDGGVRRWEKAFDEHEVDLVVNGHNHTYERTHPMRGGTVTGTAGRQSRVTAANRGTVYVTAGGGGRGASPVDPRLQAYVVLEGGDRLSEQAPWSAVREEHYHVLACYVNPRNDEGNATLRFQAVRPDGVVFDDVTLVRPAGAARTEPGEAVEGNSDTSALVTAAAALGGTALAVRAALR